MNNKKIFVACDSVNISKIRKIISKTNSSQLKIGYKFGLEFLNSKNGRNFVSKLKKKTIHFKMSKDLFKILNDEKK